MIELAPDAPWSLFEWVDMINELKALFGRDIDLVGPRLVDQQRECGLPFRNVSHVFHENEGSHDEAHGDGNDQPREHREA